MKTPIEVHLGIPLGVPREWSLCRKRITYKGDDYAALVLSSSGRVMPILKKDFLVTIYQQMTFPNQTAALEWIAKQIKDSEKE